LLSWHYSREFARLSESLAIEREFADVARQQRQDAEQERDALVEALRTTQAERDEAGRAGAETLEQLRKANGKILDLEARLARVVAEGDRLHDRAAALEVELAKARQDSADIERRCDVELARRTEVWKAHIAELERQVVEQEDEKGRVWVNAVQSARREIGDVLRRVEKSWSLPESCCGVDTSEQEEAS